jgi:thioredoxin 1
MELENTINQSQFKSLLEQEPALMIYFYQENCGVCKQLLPKVKSLIDNSFPKIKFVVLNAEKNKELAAQLRMLSVPGILLFFDQKEFVRANGLISLLDLENKIKRPYRLLFD